MRLLDSDVMIDLLRRHQPTMDWLGSLPDAPGLPGVVVLELIWGCRNKKELRVVNDLVKSFRVYWPSADESNQAISLYSQLRLNYLKMGIPDILIAVCAMGLGATLCTFNTKHMAAVPGLSVEVPYSKTP